ncbi:MAG: RagB/SusD family nutrient uptake outer membrane protein [Bacteroidales bacterium]|nr:RagB/SusD family nutrient uptake outer membrane protein [Bacteroidales bacterium]
MKNYIFSAMTAVLILSACSLKENPTSFVNRTNYYGNETQCIAALNGCYLPMAFIYVPNYMLAVEACTDIWYSRSTTVDACLDVTPAKPQMGAAIWRQGYLGVMRCNECIECIAAANIPPAQKEPLVAEARVLRALYYYNLTCFFGGVPYYKEMVADDDALLRIRRLPRTDPREIREDLYYDIRDLALPYFTEENGRKVRASEAKSQRVGYALGLMLMAKMALWNEDWDLALAPLKLLEALYGELTEERYPLEQTMWRYKNTMESILEIQHDWSKTGVQFAGSVANIMTPPNAPSPDNPDLRLFDGIALPELGNEVTSWSALVANNIYGIFRPATGTTKTENTSYQNALFNPLPLTYSDEYNTQDGRYYTQLDLDAIAAGVIRGQKIDRRIYYTLGLGNYSTGATFQTSKRYGVGWAGPKFWCPGEVQTYDSNNYKIFRYADAVLMMAECYIGLENADEALRYINMVRTRAGVEPETNFTGFEALTALLRCERARELGGEFQRKFDLVRWGVWYEQTRDNTNNATLRNRMKRCHRYYPIPDVQCALSGRVLTNDEYVAEGM